MIIKEAMDQKTVITQIPVLFGKAVDVGNSNFAVGNLSLRRIRFVFSSVSFLRSLLICSLWVIFTFTCVFFRTLFFLVPTVLIFQNGIELLQDYVKRY